MRAARMRATLAVIAAILLMFGLEAARGIPLFGVGNEDLPQLVRMGAIVGGMFQPGSPVEGEYWRLLAAMFIHIGTLHLLLNLWALYQLGFLFELMFGSTRFLLTYFTCGIVASLASAILTDPGVVAAGASGAIFGILGALIFSIRRSPVWRHEPWTKNLLRQLTGWAVINIIIGFNIAGIDNAAHLGGFITGLLLGFIPHKVPPPPPGRLVIDTPSNEPE